MDFILPKSRHTLYVSIYALVLLSSFFVACDSKKSNNANLAESVPRRISILVTGSGYEPSTVQTQAGEHLVLVFKRITDQGCGQQLVFPDRDIRRELPLNQEVEVELTPRENETIAFTCGMGMYRGSVVASAR